MPRTNVRYQWRGAQVKGLSARQQNIIGFIRRFLTDNGFPPTVRDIQAGCGISSTSVVDYNLNILEKSGHLKRRREVSRGIEVAGAGQEKQVPIIGVIAAGQPIPVPDADTWDPAANADTIGVNKELTRGKAGVYALRVKGTSMIDALINDGDIVLMEHVTTVDNGEMAAVWLKAEKEVTLKKVYVKPGRVRLQPANSQMKPIYTRPDNVEIQGRVVAVIRQMG